MLLVYPLNRPKEGVKPLPARDNTLLVTRPKIKQRVRFRVEIAPSAIAMPGVPSGAPDCSAALGKEA